MTATWRVVTHVELAAEIMALAAAVRSKPVVPTPDQAAPGGPAPDRVGPVVVAVNGHSSSGKTTLAGRLADVLPGAAVLHTDDLAWHQGVFAWDELLLHDVLPVVRAGRPLAYRPPQWVARGRDGEITLPGDLQVLVVEGVGASQPSVRAAYDVVVWVETEELTRIERDAPRVAAREISQAGYDQWMAEENAYVTADRPWRHADLIVTGGTLIPHDPTTQIPLRSGAVLSDSHVHVGT